MRRRGFFWLACLFVIWTSACTTLRLPPPIDTAKACASWRWIGISQPEARCPKIPGWTVEPLFPQLAPIRQASGGYCPQEGDEEVPGIGLIAELNRFCVYEAPQKWLGHRPPPPPPSAGLVRLDQDCAALSAGGDETPETGGWEPFAEHLLAQAGLPGEAFTIANPSAVRLAFLDTQPTSGELPTTQGYSPHGYTLAQIARHLVCRGESCAARITTRLALPYKFFDAESRKLSDIDTVHGGYLGTQSDLAVAIQQEVAAWHDARESSQQHLVLNLSLAWDGEIFGGLDEAQIDEMKAGTQAVYRALQYAAGFDVLVLAAAGNQKGEPCNNRGPLLPAAWERETQRVDRCGESRDERPLLYAVGGLNSKGDFLASARPGGMPRRAAYAENAVVACPGPENHTAMLTGSSVATAIASSIASVVWAAHPQLTSSQVMAVLDESGKELAWPADFWFPANPTASNIRPKVHRLSLCQALEKAREKYTPDLPRLSCDTWPPQSFDSLVSFPTKSWGPNSCQPWLYPQPEADPCPVCPPRSR
jgi:hypothetical protein